MAINIDGLTTAGALDPNDLFELQQAGVNKKLELGELWVIAKGINTIELYKSATATTTMRPGVIHINDGTDDYLRESTGFTNLTITGATGWSFITCTQALTFTQRAATGTVAQRPTSTCYTYIDGADTGYNHTKNGFYYSADEKIIGAVYWDGSAIQYTTNNLSNTYEIGTASTGGWTRVGKKQFITAIAYSASSATATYTYPASYTVIDGTTGSQNNGASSDLVVAIGSVTTSLFTYALIKTTTGAYYTASWPIYFQIGGNWRT